MFYDLIIENATIIDGLGNPAKRGSLAVTNGRISAIDGAELGRAETRQRIDASQMVLAPGIIDLHTHYDAQLTWDSSATPSVGLGVTTVVIGNCGFTIAPCRRQDRDLTLRNLTHVEGMSLEALQTGVDWDFESYPEYLDLLERKGLVPNVASFVGHSSVRTYVLGHEASQRTATPAEITRMKHLVSEALEAGAAGFATSTLEQHNGDNGVPMPSRLADEDEMLALTGALGDAGKGVFMLTKGMTTTVPWLEKVAASNDRPVMIAAMFVDPNDPERVFNELGQISKARSRGRELWAQVGCFPLGMEFSLSHPYPFEAFLAWHPAIAIEGSDDYHKLLADPAFRASIKAEAVTRNVPNRFSYHQWAHARIKQVQQAKNQALVGRIIGELANSAGADPFDWFMDFALDGEMDALIDCKMFNLDEDAVIKLLNHPHAAVALSDAGAHLSFLCDAGFGLHMFGHWVRERSDMTLEQAVQKVTSQPADVYRIKERGRLVPGAWADMILFDPARIGRGEKRRVNDLPGGGSRVDTSAVGLHGVWINGVRTVDDQGLIAGSGTPGQLLRDFSD
jgi:N-acyl-D-aspartate/D-glutamate deacylase